jgi:hypothetical protein
VDALMAPEQAGCTGHPDLAGEFRELGRTALDRLEPWLARVRDQAAAAGDPDSEAGGDGEPVPAACAVCPVCAVIALIRGQRSELAVRLSDQVAGLVSVLRTALDEGSTAPGSTAPGTTAPGSTGPTGAEAEGASGSTEPPPGGGRVVQHIAVVRADPSAG